MAGIRFYEKCFSGSSSHNAPVWTAEYHGGIKPHGLFLGFLGTWSLYGPGHWCGGGDYISDGVADIVFRGICTAYNLD